jgi:DNA-directed RNA polymerase subunit beta'
MRTFHIGGTAKFEEHSTLEARHDGIIRFVNCHTVKSRSGGLVVMNRNAEIHVLDDQGRSRAKYTVPYGAHIRVEDGSRVNGPKDQNRGTLIAEWDPFSIPILTEVDGTVKFGDIIEGKTMQEQVDEVTGLSRKVIIEFRGTDMRPRVSIKDKKGKTAKLRDECGGRHLLSVGVTSSSEGMVHAGHRQIHETTKRRTMAAFPALRSS